MIAWNDDTEVEDLWALSTDTELVLQIHDYNWTPEERRRGRAGSGRPAAAPKPLRGREKPPKRFSRPPKKTGRGRQPTPKWSGSRVYRSGRR